MDYSQLSSGKLDTAFQRDTNASETPVPSGFLHNRQQIVVFEIAHEQMPYRSRHPAIRILGLFASDKLARQWIRRIETTLPEDERGVFFAAPVMTPILMVNSEQRMSDCTYRARKVEQIITERNAWLALREEEHVARRARDKERLEAKNARLKARHASEAALDPDGTDEPGRKGREKGHQEEDDAEARRWLDEDAQWQKKYRNAFRNVEGRTQLGSTSTRAKALSKRLHVERAKRKAQCGELEELPWPTSLTLSDQLFVCVGFIADITREARKGTGPNEPIVIVFRAFQTEADAVAWSQSPTVAEKVKDPPIFTVNAFSWLYPTLIDNDKIKEKYSDKRVEQLVTQRKHNDSDLEMYDAYCREHGLSTAGKTTKGANRRIIESGDVTPMDKPFEPEEGKTLVTIAGEELKCVPQKMEPVEEPISEDAPSETVNTGEKLRSRRRRAAPRAKVRD